MAKKKKRKSQQQNNQVVSPDYKTAANASLRAISGLNRKEWKTISKGLTYDWVNNSNFNNVVYPRDKIPDRMLRLIERKNGIIASIITLNVQQVLEFCKISHDKDVPGWEFVLKDENATMDKKHEQQKDFLENLLLKAKVDNYNGLIKHNDTLKSIMTKYARDRVLIDKICWEIERNRRGEAVALWVLDGATIMPILPGGFYGSTSQIAYGVSPGYNKLSDEIRKAKIDSIPPVEDISYVQELFFGTGGGGITAAFTDDDIIYDLSNELNEIHYYKQGLSVTEKANIAVTAFINALTYNSNGLSRASIPKIAISMGKDSSYTQEELEDAQDEWAANLSAMDGQWNIPLLNADAKVLNLFPNNRDMEYHKYTKFVAAIICATCGVDSAELGLKLDEAQSILSENQDARQKFSKSRRLYEMLGGFAYIVNQFTEKSGYDFAKEWTFIFNGLNVTDKNFEADLRKKAVETSKTINEIREEDDLPPDPYGDIICNPQYVQYRLAKEQQEQMQEQDQMGEGDTTYDEGFDFTEQDLNETVDSAMQSMGKSVRLI